MQDILTKLKELSLELPAVPAPVASYVPAKRSGNTIYVSGQLPSKNGMLPTGHVPTEISADEAKEASKNSFMNCLAAAAALLNDGETLSLVQLQGFVSSTPDFYEQPAVINGASDLALAILGERGKHARAAVGVPALPKNAVVEVACVFEAIAE